MSASCSNASQQIESMEADIPPPPPNKKYSIIVEMDGAKGQDSSKWASRCGVLIRRHIPVSYDDWRKVDIFYKNNLWRALMVFYFTLSTIMVFAYVKHNCNQYFFYKTFL